MWQECFGYTNANQKPLFHARVRRKDVPPAVMLRVISGYVKGNLTSPRGDVKLTKWFLNNNYRTSYNWQKHIL